MISNTIENIRDNHRHKPFYSYRTDSTGVSINRGLEGTIIVIIKLPTYENFQLDVLDS